MVELVVVDCGRSGTKVVTDGTRDCFQSKLGEYRDLHLERKMERTDMIVEYAGQKYYVGGIARESVSGAQMMLASKAHMDTKILILSALHRVIKDNMSVFLIIGEPIVNHTPVEKLRMKQLLLGSHEIAVNGELKHFDIVRVEVAAECATVGWSMRRDGTFHIMDPGSRTVNFATMKNGKWIDKLSGTLDYGLETVQNISLSMFSRMTPGFVPRSFYSLKRETSQWVGGLRTK